MIRLILITAMIIAVAKPVLAKDLRGMAIRTVAPTGETVKGEQWLLTIGIDTYLSWPRLNTAVNDAKALKSILVERYTFDDRHVIELYDENATRKNILGALRDLTKKIKHDDSLLIFYAGHGHIDSITKKGSWIPVESSTDDPSAWISNQDIKDYLNIDAIQAKHILLVSDSCFSGDFFRGQRGALPEVTNTVIKKAYKLNSRQAITSGGLEPVSDAGFGGNSIFTHFLVSVLKSNTSPYLIPSEIFPAVKSGVAQNAEQFPQMGSLYGVGGQEGGEMVFFLKPENRLENLSAGSAARKKELEQLEETEAEVNAAKQKEQSEIAKRERELAALDKQIAEMKERLGTSSARSNDSLDSIIAMADQKEQQGLRLDELRRQREEDERERQGEIEQLKLEAKEKQAENVKSDLAKYERIASSKYAQDMKSAAWRALLAGYPEAKKVPTGDVNGFLAALGLLRDNDDIITPEEKKRRDDETLEKQEEEALRVEQRSALEALEKQKKIDEEQREQAVVRQAIFDDFTFRIIQCSKPGTSVHCTLQVINNSNNEHMIFVQANDSNKSPYNPVRNDISYFWDDNGNQAEATEVQLGGTTSNETITVSLPPNQPIKFDISFLGVSPVASTGRLRLKWGKQYQRDQWGTPAIGFTPYRIDIMDIPLKK